MARKQITLSEFLAELKAQGVPREHIAFKCPMCKTVQSMASLIVAGVESDRVESYIGFSCIGRWTNAGGPEKDVPPGRGCNWTLGGLLQLHELEVLTEDGKASPHFAPASPDEAKSLMERLSAASV